MHINGSKDAGVSIEVALREYIEAIVREELKTDCPKVAEGTAVLSEDQWSEQHKLAQAAGADGDTAALEDSEDDSPEPDAAPTMEDAVARAKEVMTEDGGRACLKTALSAVGATRVSAIPEDKIAEFMEALDD